MTISNHRYGPLNGLINNDGEKVAFCIVEKDKIICKSVESLSYYNLFLLSPTLVEALEEIADPISYMRKRLKEGEYLDGHKAMQLANDPHFLKSIAREALAKLEGREG